MRHFDRDFALTNRLRTEATDHLLSAGRAVGVRRFVAQSYAGWPYARTGGPVKTEEDPLDPAPVDSMRARARGDPPPRGRGHRRRVDRGHRPALRRLLRPRHLAGARRRARRADPQAQVPGRRRRRRGLVVRPHRGRRRGHRRRARARPPRRSTTSSTTSRRRSPSGCRRWRRRSARSRRAACRAGSAGWLAGEAAAVMMTEVRGASNAKAKRELGWQPRHPSWRQGLAGAAA